MATKSVFRCRKCKVRMAEPGTCFECKLKRTMRKAKIRNQEVGPNGNFIVGCIK